jgi:hypothetical protein
VYALAYRVNILPCSGLAVKVKLLAELKRVFIDSFSTFLKRFSTYLTAVIVFVCITLPLIAPYQASKNNISGYGCGKPVDDCMMVAEST